MGWFEKGSKDMQNTLVDFQNQVNKFNSIAGKTYDPDLQLKLCIEEGKEVIEAYEKRDKATFLKEVCDCAVVSLYGSVVDVEWLFGWSTRIDLLVDAIDDGITFDALTQEKLLAIVIDIFDTINADWKKAMQEVCNSNMSKFVQYCPALINKYDDHCNTLMEPGRYEGVVWGVYDGLVFWKDKNDKILKGYKYVEADVSRFIN